MAGTAIQHASVNTGASTLGKAVEEVVHQLGLQIAYVADANLRIYYGGCPAAKIYRSQPQSFVHRHDEIAGPQNASLRAKSFTKQLS